MDFSDVLVSELYHLADEDSASLRMGTVVAVDAEAGRIDADVAGEVLKDIPYAAGLAPIVGEQVWLIRQGTWFLCIGAGEATGQGGGGGGGEDEVAIYGTAPPTDMGLELWVNPDEDSAGEGVAVEEVVVSALQPAYPVELWVDTAGSIDVGFYVHNQAVASNDWVVVHGMGRMPTVQAFDAGGSMIVGSVHHDSVNQLTIHFYVAITGKAYCT